MISKRRALFRGTEAPSVCTKKLLFLQATSTGLTTPNSNLSTGLAFVVCTHPLPQGEMLQQQEKSPYK